jgi:hypothetical protein
MSDGQRPRRRLAQVVAIAASLLSSCATPEPEPRSADDPPSAVAPVPHALAQPRALGADPQRTDARPSGAPALEFVKPGESAIEGRVFAPGGEPVEGAQILLQQDVTGPMPRTVRACTGFDGRFRVAAPRDRPVVLRVVTPTSPPHGFRHPVERVRVEAGGAKDLVVRLRAGETIAGRVVDGDGNAVAGLPLRTRWPPAMSSGDYVAAESVTSEEGSFAFDGLPAGFATIDEEWRAGAVADHVLLDVCDLPTGRTGLVVLRLPVVEVSGLVRDADGAPVAKRTVVLARRGEAFTCEARTRADGSFAARVAAPGRYVVRLRGATQSGHWDRDIGELDTSDAAEREFVAPAPGD